MVYHIPALLDESINGLNIRPEGIYVDVTFGGGGHSAEILKRLDTGKLIAFDQDEDVRMNVPDDKRLIFIEQNFRFLKNNLLFNGIKAIDG
ncbi:MAG: 16S rRNA (cytosine(1402)-N(4))-methyltransferase, partial [Bacteroidales bacterium]|nr:16S rRNA (cytosine(1402)-N(4))-methyltransferase [Bacteroidales bacterium]